MIERLLSLHFLKLRHKFIQIRPLFALYKFDRMDSGKAQIWKLMSVFFRTWNENPFILVVFVKMDEALDDLTVWKYMLVEQFVCDEENWSIFDGE